MHRSPTNVVPRPHPRRASTRPTLLRASTRPTLLRAGLRLRRPHARFPVPLPRRADRLLPPTPRTLRRLLQKRLSPSRLLVIPDSCGTDSRAPRYPSRQRRGWPSVPTSPPGGSGREADTVPPYSPRPARRTPPPHPTRPLSAVVRSHLRWAPAQPPPSQLFRRLAAALTVYARLPGISRHPFPLPRAACRHPAAARRPCPRRPKRLPSPGLRTSARPSLFPRPRLFPHPSLLPRPSLFLRPSYSL